MSIKARLYHNPMCSKSRAAVASLCKHGIEYEEIRYLETPPSVEDLVQICQILNCHATDIIRHEEVLFQAMGLSLTDDRDHQAWLEILHKHPKLIQRPIVIIDNRGVIARPVEVIESLLTDLNQ